MGYTRRLVITGIIQLAAFLLLIYYAVVFVGPYYFRLALITAPFVDAVTSINCVVSSIRERGDNKAGNGQFP